jgi:hypothetical protein
MATSAEPLEHCGNGSDPEATSTDLARASEALGLFISDTVACLHRNG